MSDAAQQLSEATALATPVLEKRPQETSNEEQPAAEPSFDPAYEKRRQRILDHRAEAQDDTNTMRACLAGVNSDLLDCELHVGETLRHALARGGLSIDEIERNARLFELLVRLTKQVAQITQLEMRTRKDDTEAKNMPLCAPTGIASKPLPTSTQNIH
jgi:hypothetical protein